MFSLHVISIAFRGDIICGCVRVCMCVVTDVKFIRKLWVDVHVGLCLVEEVLGETRLRFGTGGCSRCSNSSKDEEDAIFDMESTCDLLRRLREGFSALVGRPTWIIPQKRHVVDGASTQGRPFVEQTTIYPAGRVLLSHCHKRLHFAQYFNTHGCNNC